MEKWINCTDGFIEQDIIRFHENVWSKPKSKRVKPQIIGERTVVASVTEILDQEKFTHITVLSCEGDEALAKDTETKRLYKNIIKGNVHRLLWSDETARDSIKG